ncbi:MAG: hypothetical protein EVJ48_03060 [Candidatus Acidulodesulfobacterium acidiphilum]|uniref:Uncharacterized protein n=1 Tax=Candidatus Acidulodesulfobacterium acidiphilum TaxID=2597224 RepID=A0A520XFE1_9DELT|nr:MAG: hypothetical protein EVJ48_03060 [Candidatus Acidulodesulfobacterium acidiphilum]
MSESKELVSLRRGWRNFAEWFAGLSLQKKRIFTSVFYMLIIAVIAFEGKGVSAATVSTSGTGSSFYNTIVGFFYGPIGITVGILLLAFGALMLVKHWLITVFCVIALLLFYGVPYLVLSVASTGAAASGAMI